ncbi:DUF4398 domain-containing protein [Streptomyces sp. 11x1]|uniref:DUF4398 domain-containing protein n=1 Tax=Streptomyces sp. 11x1 TaxID=3038642 RepID=UPI00292F8B3B|nr:DUF4398 domain-containing protein [Streptomyces sp. 11x1]WNZ08284.1 DUF4398 domain-containing protein [Streptomyces sp. 11x1]
MSEQPARKQPTPQHTDFESMTHAQLVAMLNSANSESAYDLAAKLSKAASTITKIGDDLMTYVKGLEWQGEAGDTFREWGGQTASATLHLGEYAEVASRWMGIVSQAIGEAKAVMPDTSETTAAQADLRNAEKSLAAAKEPGARNDPDSRKLAQTAQSDATAAQERIDAARYEAVQQMRKLAQAYQQSAAQVNRVEPPTFSPPGNHLGAGWVDTNQQYISGPSQGTSGSFGSPSASAVPERSQVSRPDSSQSSLPLQSGERRIERFEPIGMDLDGLVKLPEASGPSSPVTPAPGGPPARSESTPHFPSGIGLPSLNGGGSVQNPVTGRGPSATRVPFQAVQGSPNGTATRMPRESGILGGRPVPPSSGRTGGIPRGTVIGGDPVQGRAPMTRGTTPGVPSGGNINSGQNGVVGGRRLSSETGGPVGNRPAMPGRTGTRPFTPGGSGLANTPGTTAALRNSTSSGTGAASPSAVPSGSQRDQRSGQRPDYLIEDEETWAHNNRRSLPPVVD